MNVIKCRIGKQTAAVELDNGKMYLAGDVRTHASINAAKRENGLNSRTLEKFPPARAALGGAK